MLSSLVAYLCMLSVLTPTMHPLLRPCHSHYVCTYLLVRHEVPTNSQCRLIHSCSLLSFVLPWQALDEEDEMEELEAAAEADAAAVSSPHAAAAATAVSLPQPLSSACLHQSGALPSSRPWPLSSSLPPALPPMYGLQRGEHGEEDEEDEEGLALDGAETPEMEVCESEW